MDILSRMADCTDVLVLKDRMKHLIQLMRKKNFSFFFLLFIPCCAPCSVLTLFMQAIIKSSQLPLRQELLFLHFYIHKETETQRYHPAGKWQSLVLNSDLTEFKTYTRHLHQSHLGAGLTKIQISVPQSRMLNYQQNPSFPFLVAKNMAAQLEDYFLIIFAIRCSHVTSLHQWNVSRSHGYQFQAKMRKIQMQLLLPLTGSWTWQELSPGRIDDDKFIEGRKAS